MPRVDEKLDIQFVDEQYFIEQIFFRYKDYIKHLARKKCEDPNDIEDVVQSTWELLLKNMDKLSAVSENRRMAYVAAVVTNVIRMEVRKKKLDTCSLEDVLEPGYDAMLVLDRIFDQKYVKENFRQAWAKVDPYVRELLERYYLMDQSHKEIAEAMEIAPNNVRTYLHRARKAAKKELLKHSKMLEQQWNDAYT
jgi:RNA polymerase sigma-70 factor (ECF subfamily)